MTAILNKSDEILHNYWGGYTTKIRAVAKRGLVLSKKILQEGTPRPVSLVMKAINLTYILDIPLGIKDSIDEGRSLLQSKGKLAKCIGINDFFSTGLDLIDSTGTFFGTILKEDKYFLLKFYEAYSMTIGCAIELFSIAARLGRIYRACQLKYVLAIGDIQTKRISILKDTNTVEHRLFKSTFGNNGLSSLEKSLHNVEIDEFKLMANRKILALSTGLAANFLMLGLYIFSPLLGCSLALSAKVVGLALKIFEDADINKHFIP